MNELLNDIELFENERVLHTLKQQKDSFSAEDKFQILKHSAVVGNFELLSHSGDMGFDKNYVCNDGYAFIHFLCRWFDCDILENWIDSSVEVNIKTISPRTEAPPTVIKNPIILSPPVTPVGISAVISDYGLNELKLQDLENQLRIPGQTPLHWAVILKKQEVVQLLIKNGADLK